MRPENYIKEKRIINLGKANVAGIGYFVFFLILFGLPFYLIYGFHLPKLSGNLLYFKAFLPLFFIISGIIVHELIHGIFFAKFATKGFKSIKFGVIWKMMTPYCHCKEPLKVNEYKIAVLAPLIILGIIPSLIGLITGNLMAVSLGIFFSGAAGGDIMIYNIIKKEDPEDYVQDHPTEAGCYIFKKK